MDINETSRGDARISRRIFLRNSAMVVAGTTALHTAKGGSSSGTLTVIAYNIYKCNGWPADNEWSTKARNAGQIPGRIAGELALFSPDIINFSEAPVEPVVSEIAKRLGMNYAFFPSAGNWPGALLTKHKIVDSANTPLRKERPKDYFTRHWGKATVSLPDGSSVVVHSAHLFPNDTPEAGAIRKGEIPIIIESAREDLAKGASVIVMGDLNHTPEMPEYQLWMDAGWVDTFSKAGEGDGLTIKADRPTKRIDYVLVNGPLSRHVVRSKPLYQSAFRTNPDDPSSFALSDHLPQMAQFNIP